MTTEDVANQALNLLDEATIDSLDDNNLAARIVNLHIDQTRQAELQKYAWVFAIFKLEVDGSDTGSGVGTLNYVYEVPEDALRVLPLTYDGEPTGVPISWRQEAGLIYSDQESPRIIRYIANLTDPNDMDALFIDVWVAALAFKLAMPITHKQSTRQDASAAYREALSAARRANAIERSGRLQSDSWAQARGDWRSQR